jgi:hypothetical protein
MCIVMTLDNLVEKEDYFVGAKNINSIAKKDTMHSLVASRSAVEAGISAKDDSGIGMRGSLVLQRIHPTFSWPFMRH